ncbi:MAG: hypothetical protein ACXWUG_23890, partial [Polyangiales bacterium]
KEADEGRRRARTLEAKLHELEDSSRLEASKSQSAIASLRRELEVVTFDRDVADEQLALMRMQVRAAEAKVELVEKQVGWTGEALDDVAKTLAGLDRATQELVETKARLAAAASAASDRLASARTALVTAVTAIEPSPPPGEPNHKSNGADEIPLAELARHESEPPSSRKRIDEEWETPREPTPVPAEVSGSAAPAPAKAQAASETAEVDAPESGETDVDERPAVRLKGRGKHKSKRRR